MLSRSRLARGEFAVAASVMMGLVACSDSDGDTSTEVAEVTYWQSVAPIFAEKCVQCHQTGGIGPFRLDNFEDAVRFGAAAKAATSARTMPPYLVEADGSCGDFEDSRALTDQEINLIRRWVDEGQLQGEARTDLVPESLPTLGTDALSVTTPTFIPEIAGGELAEFDEYRCFLLDPGVDEDTFLTGFEVLPGNAALVHHVLAFPVDLTRNVGGGQTNADVIAALDAASPNRDGWPCYSMAGEGVDVDGVPVTWAPGTGAVLYPAGSGVEFPGGNQVVVQVHYNLARPEVRGQSDSTTLRLQFQQNVQRLGFFVLEDELLETRLDGNPVVIPAGSPSFEYQFEVGYDGFIGLAGRLDLFGVFPHMHEFGRTLRIERIRGGQSTCLASVGRWDFDWQLMYFYRQAVDLQSGDRIRVTCTYNTEGLTEPVLPGWGTRNEMCLAGLYITLPPGLGL